MLHVIYLVFNEGYSPSSGAALTRADLSAEAIRLARLVAALLPEPEAIGLLALLLLHESRRAARATKDGGMILLADQDRALWDREAIAEGMALARRAFAAPEIGSYTLQAAIAAEHAGAETAEATDWGESPPSTTSSSRRSPRPWCGSTGRWRLPCATDRRPASHWSTPCSREGDLARYPFAHSARADFCRQLGRQTEARGAYGRALELTSVEPERRFLEGRIAELGPA